MHTNARLLTIGGTAAAAGGFAWLAKIAVIAANDGANSAEGAAAVFFVLGIALGPLGLGVCAYALTAGRHAALRAGAAVLGACSFFVAFVVIDSVANSAVGDAGPAWLGEEMGILATGAVLMAVGLAGVRGAQQRAAALSV